MVNPESELRERTKRFALSVVSMLTALPKTDAANAMGQQALRSGISIGPNAQEAFQGRSRVEFIVKAGDYIKELESTAHWLQLLVDRQIVDEMRMTGLRKECDELAAIFTAMVKTGRK